MAWVLVVAAAIAGLALGWWLDGLRAGLYRDREAPRGGAGALAQAVATAMAWAFASRPGHYDAGPALLAAAFASVLLLIARTDIERRLVPNRLTYPAFIAALAFAWGWPDRTMSDVFLGAGIGVGVAAGLVVLGLLASGGRDPGAAMGIGDAKLVILLGAMLGWPLLGPALVIGVVLGGAGALLHIVRTGARERIAYAPYLVLGGLVALLWPERFL